MAASMSSTSMHTWWRPSPREARNLATPESWRGGRDELHPAHPVPEDGGPDLLLGDLLHVGQLESQGVSPQLDALLEVADHDGDVVEALGMNGHRARLLAG